MKRNNATLISTISRRDPRAFRWGIMLVLILCLLCPAQAQHRDGNEKGERNGQGQRKAYSTIFYKSGDLQIEAYLFKPEVGDRFPVVIYSHGSRGGQERKEVPFAYVAKMLTAHGYAVLVPERRGYGKSDGPTFSEEVGQDKGDKLIHRFHEEAADVIASLDYLKSLQFVDRGRIAIMGWSFGGIVSVFAASESDAFRALVDQAGAALSWKHSPELQHALTAAARRIKIPSLCQDAQNDATTDAVTTIGDAIRSTGATEKTIIYPPFTPTINEGNIAPGHLIFSAQGMAIWQDDVLSFLKRHVGSGS